jgi:hypothetical protein
MDELSLKPDPRIPSGPEFTAVDFAVLAAKVGSIVFSWAGSAVTLFDIITGPSRSNRLTDWCEKFRVCFNDLGHLGQKAEGLTPEALANNEAFISAFAQATQAALKTHQQDKLEALKNAVVNVALGSEPDADRQQQFLSLVDRFKDPAGYFQTTGRQVPLINSPTVEPVRKLLAYQLVIDAMPSLGQQLKSPSPDRSAASFQFIELVFGDLVSAKLISLERLNDTWTVPKFDQTRQPSPVKPLITHLGDDFLSFITYRGD